MLHGRRLPAGLLLGAAGLLAASFLAAQDEGHKKEGSKNKEGPPKCDLAKVENVQRCHDCDSDMESTKCRCGKSKECQCKEKKHEVAVCLKVFSECTKCHNQQFKSGKCAKCGEKTEEKKDRADIIYRCDTDDVTAEKPGKCDKCKAALVRTCKKSGEFPHVVPK